MQFQNDFAKAWKPLVTYVLVLTVLSFCLNETNRKLSSVELAYRNLEIFKKFWILLRGWAVTCKLEPHSRCGFKSEEPVRTIQISHDDGRSRLSM